MALGGQFVLSLDTRQRGDPRRCAANCPPFGIPPLQARAPALLGDEVEGRGFGAMLGPLVGGLVLSGRAELTG